MRLTDQTILGDAGDCMSACLATLLGVPTRAVPYLNSPYWRETMVDYLEPMGLHPWVTQRLPAGSGPAIVLGSGPRGRRHAVVGDGVGLLHDPHPSRAGLVGEPDGFIVLMNLRDMWP